ncbi:hypothetical protein K7X08_004726 [Anisodus acutangulus]|uniref:Uncharacterized protein n=1 Tax=Anisodus acutangulus TaxID=402998 RepID=A0A9Q1MDY9_9SOLA|nr:hypothetical protein K7X08_004726 [Anisodus acutangulus]
MLADAVQGIRRRKFWLPCRFFTLNAASLTLLGVVVKLPLDLNNPMPGEIDQMAKLSSVVFMSTAMANFMPSLALMDSKDIFMDMAALGILVMTLVANVCIELGTGVIYSEKIEHIVVMLSIVFLFVIMFFSALTVPTIKSYMELKYRKRVQTIAIDDLVEGEKPVEVKLKENLRNFFIMAETGDPQFVMARSATCAACCAICCLNGLLLLEVSIRDNLFGAHVKSMSDYRRSTYCISRIQSGGVAVGTVSSLIRWFAIARIKSLNRSTFKVEKRWLERLKDWKDSPFAPQIKNPKCRKLVQQVQNFILGNCIRVQILIVVVSKLVQLFPIILLSLLRSCFCSSSWCNNIINSESQSAENLNEEISRYVLHLEGEEELTEVLANKRDDTTWMIEIGRKQQPKHLIELLQKMPDFRGVDQFDNIQFQELPNGWKMHIVTLTTIATTIPNIDHKMVYNLLLSVSEGIKYVSFIEDVLIATNVNLEKNKRAADVAWSELYLYRRWLDQDLQKMALQGKTCKWILQNFADIAENYVTKDDYSRKSTKVIAANSMYQMSQIILEDSGKIDDQTGVDFFKDISVMIAGVFGACLINMPYAITKKCSASAIEKREENVQHAIHLLGEAEEFIKLLQQHEKVTPTNSSNSDSDSSISDFIEIAIE